MTRKEINAIEQEYNKIALEKPLVQPISDEELLEYSFKKERNRYKKFPDRLPAKARFPFPPDSHKHIGMYESKQNLYLLTAHAYNNTMRKIEKLTKRIEELENKVNSQ